MYSDFTLVLPTLNEEKTIGQVIDLVRSMYPDMKVIVSDDGSQDKTQGIVSGYGNGVELLDRSKLSEKGLTASVLDGILASKTEYVVVMDSDLQHPPEKIEEIAGLLRGGSDIVVGCRNPIKKWKMRRRFLSIGATYLAKASLALNRSPSCSDVLSGFFGVRRQLVVSAVASNRNRFQMNGYKVLYDLLKCLPKSTRISEIRYDFGMRRRGSSKIGSRHVIAFFQSLFR